MFDDNRSEIGWAIVDKAIAIVTAFEKFQDEMREYTQCSGLELDMDIFKSEFEQGVKYATDKNNEEMIGLLEKYILKKFICDGFESGILWALKLKTSDTEPGHIYCLTCGDFHAPDTEKCPNEMQCVECGIFDLRDRFDENGICSVCPPLEEDGN